MREQCRRRSRLLARQSCPQSATLIFIGFVLGWKWTFLRLAIGIPLVFALGDAAALVPPRGAGIGLPPAPALPSRNFLLEWARSFCRLAVRLVPEYVVIVFALGALRAWLFPVMTPAIGHAPWLAPALAAAGTLFVIPTAGEVPIIPVLQQFGLGAAGAAALLITLPAVSLPSLAMLGRVLPLRTHAVLAAGTFLYGLLAAGLAAALGLGPGPLFSPRPAGGKFLPSPSGRRAGGEGSGEQITHRPSSVVLSRWPSS